MVPEYRVVLMSTPQLLKYLPIISTTHPTSSFASQRVNNFFFVCLLSTLARKTFQLQLGKASPKMSNKGKEEIKPDSSAGLFFFISILLRLFCILCFLQSTSSSLIFFFCLDTFEICCEQLFTLTLSNEEICCQ